MAAQIAYNFTSVASATRRGNPINQDQCIVSEDEDKYKFIVADGHGPNGECVAHIVAKSLSKGLTFQETETNVVDYLKEIHPNACFVNGKLIDNGHLVRGGSVATRISLDKDTGYLIVEYLGDCLALLCKATGFELLTDEDHCPTNPNERDYMIAVDPRIKLLYTKNGMSPQPIWNPDGSMNDPLSSCTVRGDPSCSIGDGIHSIAISRSFGDRHFGYILSKESSVNFVPREKLVNSAIVLASDGLWDCAMFEEIRQIVMRPSIFGNAQLAVDSIMEFAKIAYERNFGTNVDDITVIVVYM